MSCVAVLDIMEFMNLMTLLFSAIALLGSLFTYLVHDKKLKMQQAILNELQIKKLQKEIEEEAAVEIRPTLINVVKSMHTNQITGTVLLKNYGKGEAKDVEVYACVNGGRHSHFNTKERRIKSLLPGQYEEISMDWGIGDGCIDVLLNWRDAKGMEYTSSHSLPLY